MYGYLECFADLIVIVSKLVTHISKDPLAKGSDGDVDDENPEPQAAPASPQEAQQKELRNYKLKEKLSVSFTYSCFRRRKFFIHISMCQK